MGILADIIMRDRKGEARKEDIVINPIDQNLYVNPAKLLIKNEYRGMKYTAIEQYGSIYVYILFGDIPQEKCLKAVKYVNANIGEENVCVKFSFSRFDRLLCPNDGIMDGICFPSMLYIIIKGYHTGLKTEDVIANCNKIIDTYKEMK